MLWILLYVGRVADDARGGVKKTRNGDREGTRTVKGCYAGYKGRASSTQDT